MSTSALGLTTAASTLHARTQEEATRVAAMQATPETDAPVPVSDVCVMTSYTISIHYFVLSSRIQHRVVVLVT